MALVLVIEGVLPFVAPRRLRALLLQLHAQDDRRLRLGGLLSMILGLLALQVLHWLA